MTNLTQKKVIEVITIDDDDDVKTPQINALPQNPRRRITPTTLPSSSLSPEQIAARTKRRYNTLQEEMNNEREDDDDAASTVTVRANIKKSKSVVLNTATISERSQTNEFQPTVRMNDLFRPKIVNVQSLANKEPNKRKRSYQPGVDKLMKTMQRRLEQGFEKGFEKKYPDPSNSKDNDRVRDKLRSLQRQIEKDRNPVHGCLKALREGFGSWKFNEGVKSYVAKEIAELKKEDELNKMEEELKENETKLNELHRRRQVWEEMEEKEYEDISTEYSKLYLCYCQLVNGDDPQMIERANIHRNYLKRIDLTKLTKFDEINTAVEVAINRMLENYRENPLMEPLDPIFSEVFKIVEEVVCREQIIELLSNPDKKHKTCEKLYDFCIKKLKARRYDDMMDHLTEGSSVKDPAESNIRLKEKLQQSQRIAAESLQNVTAQYVVLQEENDYDSDDTEVDGGSDSLPRRENSVILRYTPPTTRQRQQSQNEIESVHSTDSTSDREVPSSPKMKRKLNKREDKRQREPGPSNSCSRNWTPSAVETMEAVRPSTSRSHHTDIEATQMDLQSYGEELSLSWYK